MAKLQTIRGMNDISPNEVREWTYVEKVLKTRSSMHLRLVKGAYWDYEIKNSQVLSHIDYTVFTKKSITDLSYLACAKRIFEIDSIYPKFATHNAHTISAI